MSQYDQKWFQIEIYFSLLLGCKPLFRSSFFVYMFFNKSSEFVGFNNQNMDVEQRY